MRHIQQLEGMVDRFSQVSTPNFVKVRPVEAVSIHARRRTDRHDEDNGAFLDYAQAPKVKVWFVT